MSKKPEDNERRGYDVKTCTPDDLSSGELARCVVIITGGGAVDPDFAKAELPYATVVAVARRGTMIVGVGAIKRPRPDYAARIARESGYSFDKDLPELGYIAVDPKHRGKGLSHRLVEALLSRHGGPLFATTDDQAMKKTLVAAGFQRKGKEWSGRRGQLSLWLKQ